MQSNLFRYHFGLEWEKRKIVRRVHAKRILQTAPHTFTRFENWLEVSLIVNEMSHWICHKI